MKTHIALLRGINVGGNRKVAMADLRAFVEASGFKEARTLLNSGNLVFRSDGKRDEAALANFLETQAAKRLGLSTWFLVGSAEEWAEVIARNPFPEEAGTMPSRFLVMFFRESARGPIRWCDPSAPLQVDSERHPFLEGKQLYTVLPGRVSSTRRLGSVLLGARYRQARHGAQLEYGPQARCAGYGRNPDGYAPAALLHSWANRIDLLGCFL